MRGLPSGNAKGKLLSRSSFARKALIRFLLCLLPCTTSVSLRAEVTVTNVRATQVVDTLTVQILYNLDCLREVTVTLVAKDGETVVASPSVTGDVGAGIVAGVDRTITWNAGVDWPGHGTNNMTFEVTATGISCPTGGDATAEEWTDVTARWVRNYYANGAITMSDRDTGLMWVYDADANGQKIWNDAQTHCSGLDYAGHDDWFLPSKDQLSAMFSQKSLFKDVRSARYWSSSRGPGDHGYYYSWYLDVGNGSVSYSSNGNGYDSPSDTNWVWPCRTATISSGGTTNATDTDSTSMVCIYTWESALGDFNGNGTPDVFEDFNGNGTPDAFEDLDGDDVPDGWQYEGAGTDGRPKPWEYVSVRSSSHPSQNLWYNNGTVVADLLTWNHTGNRFAMFFYYLDQEPFTDINQQQVELLDLPHVAARTVPDETQTISVDILDDASLADLPHGTHYLHVRAISGLGDETAGQFIGPTTHYRINVNRHSPVLISTTHPDVPYQFVADRDVGFSWETVDNPSFPTFHWFFDNRPGTAFAPSNPWADSQAQRELTVNTIDELVPRNIAPQAGNGVFFLHLVSEDSLGNLSSDVEPAAGYAHCRVNVSDPTDYDLDGPDWAQGDSFGYNYNAASPLLNDLDDDNDGVPDKEENPDWETEGGDIDPRNGWILDPGETDASNGDSDFDGFSDGPLDPDGDGPIVARDQTGNPSPPSNSENVPLALTLTWDYIGSGTSFDVYIGEDRTAVEAADVSSDFFAGNQTDRLFIPTNLEANHEYLWRVDAVEAGKKVKGQVWAFRVSPSQVSAVTASGERGAIRIDFTITDAGDSGASVGFWYRMESGEWIPSAAVSGRKTGLHNGEHTVAWQTATDLGEGVYNNVEIRMATVDGVVTGTFVSTPIGTVTNTNLPSVTAASVPDGELSGSVPVDFTLTDADTDELRVDLLYSIDEGVTWLPCTFIPFGVTYASGEEGQVHWYSHLNTRGLRSDQVRLRVVPLESDGGHAGIPFEIGPFDLDNNAPPTVTRIEPIMEPREGGTLTLCVSVRDEEGDDVSLQVELKRDADAEFVTVTTVVGTEALGTTAAGVGHQLTWYSDFDIPDTSSGDRSVEIRITASDEALPGDVDDGPAFPDPALPGVSFEVWNDNTRPSLSNIRLEATAEAGAPTGMVMVSFDAVDGDGDQIQTCNWQYRVLPGEEWMDIAPSAILDNVFRDPDSGLTIRWDTRAGAVSLDGQQGEILFRMEVFDSRKSVGSRVQRAEEISAVEWEPGQGVLASITESDPANALRLHASDSLLSIESKEALSPAILNDVTCFRFSGGNRYIVYSHPLWPVGAIDVDRSTGEVDTFIDLQFHLAEIQGLSEVEDTHTAWLVASTDQDLPLLTLRNLDTSLTSVPDGAGGNMEFPSPVVDPTDVWYDGDAGTLWILDRATGDLLEWAPATQEVIGRVPLGLTNAFSLTHDGSRFWVAEEVDGGARITRLMAIPYSRYAVSEPFVVDNSNHPPIADQLTLTLKPDGSLEAGWRYADQEGEPSWGTVVHWYEDLDDTVTLLREDTGTAVDTDSRSTLNQADMVALRRHFARGASYYFTVTPSDGIQAGLEASSLDTTVTGDGTSQSILYPNNAPSLPADVVRVTPDGQADKVTVTATLTAVVDGLPFDTDGDPVTLLYQWLKGQPDSPDPTPVTAESGSNVLVIGDHLDTLGKYDEVFCRVTPTDGQAAQSRGSAQSSNAVKISNAPPTVSGQLPEDLSFAEGSTYSVRPADVGVGIADPDPGDTAGITYSYSYGFGGRTTATGTLTHDELPGEHMVTVTLTSPGDPAIDIGPVQTVIQFPVTVVNTNRPPAWEPLAPRTVRQTDTLTVDVGANVHDPDDLNGDPGDDSTAFTITKTSGPGELRETADGWEYEWTPGYGDLGTYQIEFQASDGLGGSTPKTLGVTVTKQNRAPILTVAPAIQLTTGSQLRLDVTADDPDGDTVVVQCLSTLPSGAVLLDTEDGKQLQWTPDFAQAGTYELTFRATDDDPRSLSIEEATVVTVVPEATDDDMDEMPDAWENESLGGTDVVHGGPGEDLDGDGMTNLEEYLAGTDPDNVNDVLCHETRATVRWLSVKGRRYIVEYTNDNWRTVNTSETYEGTGAELVWPSPWRQDGADHWQYRIDPVE